MSKEDRLNMFNEEVRIGPYSVPENAKAFNRNIITNEATVFDEGTHFFTGKSLARRVQQEVTNIPAIKIDGYDRQDIYIDFAITWHFNPEEIQFDKYGNSSVVKSANRKKHRVNIFELFLSSESNLEESMKALLKSIARKHLTGLPFTIVQKIDILDEGVVEESKNKMVNEYKELYNNLINAAEKDDRKEELKSLQNELADKIADIEKYHENFKARLLSEKVSIFDKINKEFKEECYNKYGIVVEKLALEDVSLPKEVNDLYNDKIKAIQEAANAKIRAHGVAESKVIDATSDAQVTEINAVAQANKYRIENEAKNEVDAQRAEKFKGYDYKFVLATTSPKDMNKVSEKTIKIEGLGEAEDKLLKKPTTIESVAADVLSSMEAKSSGSKTETEVKDELFDDTTVEHVFKDVKPEEDIFTDKDEKKEEIVPTSSIEKPIVVEEEPVVNETPNPTVADVDTKDLFLEGETTVEELPIEENELGEAEGKSITIGTMPGGAPSRKM